MERVSHPFAPLYDARSKILILGTMPSVTSREQNFYYAHPANRFYKVLAGLFDCEAPETLPQKKAMLLGHGVALFDVIRACDIHASADASIKNAQPNDFSEIFAAADIRQVFANGKKAFELYGRLCEQQTGRGCICLPSTSAANAAVRLEGLIAAWSAILPYLRQE